MLVSFILYYLAYSVLNTAQFFSDYHLLFNFYASRLYQSPIQFHLTQVIVVAIKNYKKIKGSIFTNIGSSSGR